MTTRRSHGWVALGWCSLFVCCGTAPARIDPAHHHSQRPTPEALYRLANNIAAHGDLVRAEEYASLAVTAGFPLDRALPFLVGVCIRASRFSVALAHAELGLSRNPANVRLRYLVASIYFALNRPDAALRELESVLSADPDHAAAARMLEAIRGHAP